MPELPEVETTVRGITPHLVGRRISAASIHERRLRWPVPRLLEQRVVGKTVHSISRRAKYILIELDDGYVMVHLGMSGTLRLTSMSEMRANHDHVEFAIDGEKLLRFRDPRRFGSVLWIDGDPNAFHLLANLGVEPLGEAFDGQYLYRAAKGRKVAVKNFIMDSRIVVGVGNIYASEALFRAGIHPLRAAGRISVVRFERLACAIRETLSEAIAAGGTTLRDFVDGSGNPGYFKHDLKVYERDNEPCLRCAKPVQRRVIGQRSTYFCNRCQR